MSVKKEILFDGYFYDVTDFIDKHPGGTVIDYYTEKGEDSTHAIQQFHMRSKEKVKLMMSALKKRPASDSEIGLDPSVLKKNRNLTKDFTELHLELERDGYFKPSYLHAFIRLMEVVIFLGVGGAMVFNQSFVIKLLGTFFITLARIRGAFLVHELGHYSYSGNSKIDRIVCALLHGVVVGLSAARWKRQHNRHHAMPQRLNHDVDLDTMPLMAFNAKVLQNSKYGNRFIIKNQVSLYVLDTLLIALVWQFYSDPKFILKRKLRTEFAVILVHCALYFHFGFFVWFFSTWIGTTYALITFSLNHTFLPITTEPTHWVEYSLLHTADVVHAPWCGWATGYLNYQIEHHLFPTMPNFRLPLIKDRVKKLAKKHNIPYHLHSYPEAVRKMVKNMSDVANEAKKL